MSERTQLSKTFCRCIKNIRKTIKVRKGSSKESAAIAICVRSVLGSRGRTLKKFRCGKKGFLETQNLKK
uniref:Uncharacterized protein n=1 Tax=viral metagenome TaxID=1070528 RepID=A0A6C0HEP9_9ZZZZ